MFIYDKYTYISKYIYIYTHMNLYIYQYVCIHSTCIQSSKYINISRSMIINAYVQTHIYIYMYG